MPCGRALAGQGCTCCETSGARLTCAKCKSANYYSEACQEQHWNNGHKGMCVAPEKRRPQAPTTSNTKPASETAKVNESSECPVCFWVSYHKIRCVHIRANMALCVEELRKHGGVLQACPICRAVLPDGPEKLTEHVTRVYVTLSRKVKSGQASWHTLTASRKSNMSEVLAMRVAAPQRTQFSCVWEPSPGG
jgi:hypothetical protein